MVAVFRTHIDSPTAQAKESTHNKKSHTHTSTPESLTLLTYHFPMVGYWVHHGSDAQS